MGCSSWPSDNELDRLKKMVAIMGRGSPSDVRVVVSPYRICPLGAHIDHQGGTVSAMTINKGILLGFIPSDDSQVLLRSGQFQGEVRFRVDEVQHPKGSITANNTENAHDSSKVCEECDWGNYARGALYALQRGGYHLTQGIIGFICGSEGLDSSGLSSSAAVGVAYLLALESANSLTISTTENVELDRIIENEYLGLRNGILDQSAILLSSYGCLTCMNCKTKEYMLIHLPKLLGDQESKGQEAYKILLAFSGLKHALASNPGYNCRVSECQAAARVLLQVSGNERCDPLLCNVELDVYEAHKDKLEPNLARRAEHYFSENMRVTEGLKAWASGKLEDFGRLISASGLSSVQNYECGCEPLIQLYKILLRTPGVFGARFSGAGFRGCCIAFVHPDRAEEAASFVRDEYSKVQPKLAGQLNSDTAVLICEAGDSACVI
ncbi:galacturonokinase [Magnolia sinica]|uniref:galacturonokinase n=1 Tax=Magnolia sinica TaxID=86752 RepID=UPI002658AEFF|nr:galacturonokinase [Magnolia sinica]